MHYWALEYRTSYPRFCIKPLEGKVGSPKSKQKKITILPGCGGLKRQSILCHSSDRAEEFICSDSESGLFWHPILTNW